MLIEQWKNNGGTVIVEKRKYVAGRVLLEQWNSVGGTVWWNGEVEQCWWKSVVEQWNSDGRIMWWNSGTVLVEHS